MQQPPTELTLCLIVNLPLRTVTLSLWISILILLLCVCVCHKCAPSLQPLLEVLEDRPSVREGSQNLVLALYTYEAQSDEELSFHKGSVLTVVNKVGEWWSGELNGDTGLFPSNYVQPLMEQAATPEPTRCV